MAIFVSSISEPVSSTESLAAFNLPGVPAVVSGSVGSSAGTPEDVASMALSVTRHALKPHLEHFQYLHCGFDSLDFGFYVDWGPDWAKTFRDFEDSKKKAQGTDGVLVRKRSQREYIFLPGGKGANYRYHLQFSEYHLFIAKSEQAKQSPNVYVSINSETLWKKGMDYALDLVWTDLKNFDALVDRIVPSRVDICVDFKLSTGLTLPFIQEHAVCRSRDISTYMKGETLETIYFGAAAAPVRLRIYDKGKEVMKKGEKLWFADLWGTTDFENIWRVEFQLRRTALKQFKVNTIKDLWKQSGGIWKYLTGEWFSLRLPDNDRQARRSIHPWWQEVAACAERIGANREVKREFKSNAQASAQFFIAHIAGCLPSFAVRVNAREYREAIFQLAKELHHYWGKKDFESEFIKRAIKLGHDLEKEGEDHGTE